MKSERPYLEELVEQIVDGHAVDWPTARIQARDDHEKELVQALEAIASIGRAYQPRTWEHLEILEPVGAGAYGEVFRAWDGNLEREVALKLLGRRVGDDESWSLATLHEGRLLAKVKHPNIVEVYGAVEREGRVGIWMEYVKGCTLSELLRTQGAFDWKRAAAIGVDVCSAVAAVHARRLVHRDIKAQNIMQEDGGRIILVDFGIGQHQDPIGIEPFAAGTPLYAAPELFEGERATPQSDIYSLGVLLYHLVTASFPVKGRSAHEVSAAHRRGESTLLRDVAPTLPESFVRVVERALAKNPDDRYASAGQMEKALREALSPPAAKPMGWQALGGAIVVLLLGGILLTLLLPDGPERALPPAEPAVDSEPSLAVLVFQNRTGDPSMDWLRLGLADLLITDLAQSPELRVAGTDEVYRALEAQDGLREPVTSPELAARVAAQTRASKVVLGSFFKAGETLRLTAQVQDVASGKVIAAELVEGVGESSLFQMVDELSSRVRAAILVAPQVGKGIDRELAHVSTASSDAFRLYAEGIGLQFRGQLREAIPLFERAVALDSGFALAHAKLSLLYMHTGRDETAMEHSRLALENAARASERERLYIEGTHYSWRESTYRRAIESYREAFERYPDFAVARHNETILHWGLGEYEYAIAAYEELRRTRPDLRQLYRPLALSYAARNEFERGRLVLLDLLHTGINDSHAYLQLGDFLTLWGRAREAREAYESAQSASPRTVDLDGSIWGVMLLEEDWSGLEEWRERLEGSRAHERALTLLYRGRSDEAVRILLEAADASPEVTRSSGAARQTAARILAETGREKRALEVAALAKQEGAGDVTEWETLFTIAISHARLGEWQKARRAFDELDSRSADVPGKLPGIRRHRLAGELALLQGDNARAASELEKARGLLAPRGIVTGFVRPPYHVPVWYALASAHVAQGDDASAYELFDSIVSSPSERMLWPLLYVRSFYQLAKIDARRGEDDRARRHFSRFLEHWAEGDVDSEQVREARTWVSGDR